MRKTIYLPLIALITWACAASLRAGTVKWIILPQDGQIELYCDGVYLYHQGAQVVLKDEAGATIDGSACDTITPCDKNGFALLLDDAGGEEATLVGIFNSKRHKVTPLREKGLKVRKDYAFFSDARLPVKDGSKWGYLDPDGNIPIACEYIKAMPFSGNCAPVQTKGKVSKYIKPNGDLAFRVGFNDAKINDATPFFSDGTADVAVDGRSFARINRKGKKVGGIQKEEYRNMSAWLADRRQQVENESTTPTQDDIDFPQLVKRQLTIIPSQQGHAIAKTADGKIGVLQSLPGDFVLSKPTTSQTADKNGKKQQTVATMQLEIPEGLSVNDLDFEINQGDGESRKVNKSDYQISGDMKTVTFKFAPVFNAKAKETTVGLVVKHHGLTLLDEKRAISQGKGPGPVSDKTCGICGRTLNNGQQHNHQKCIVCGYYTGDVLKKIRCEANGLHKQCDYCKKYKITKYANGYSGNKCPGKHPRPK